MADLPEYQRFCEGLDETGPPTDIAAELAALWWVRKGDWDRAHALVQDLESAASARVHAYLHRVEGDLDNARYWYKRAGVESVDGPLTAEWEMLAKLISAQASTD